MLSCTTHAEAFRDTWWMDLFERLDQTSDAEQLFEQLTTEIGALGFQYGSYGIRFPPWTTHVEAAVKVFDSYPPGWMDNYVEKAYILIDPTVVNGMRTSAPMVWSDELFSTARSLWFDARDHGLRVGIAQPAWTTMGAFGLLSLARSSLSISQAELRDLKPRLAWLTECAHRKMQYLLSAPTTEGPPALSGRETEILKWTADGKTAWEIAQILGISESTVAFHLRNVNSKLGSQTKVQAVAKAAALGLFSNTMSSRDTISTLSYHRDL